MDRRYDNTLIMCGLFSGCFFYLAFLWGCYFAAYPIDFGLPLRFALHAQEYAGPVATVGYISALIGLLGVWAGWESTKPPRLERQVSGPRLTESAEAMQADLARAGRLDGIRIAPGLAISRQRETQHMCLLGESGGGKTQIMIPMLAQAIGRGDKIVVYDFKSDLEAFLAPGEATLIAPWHADCAAWDIAADLRNAEHARKFAASIVPDATGSNAYFYDAARAVFAAIIAQLQANKGQEWGFTDLVAVASLPIDQLYSALIASDPLAAAPLSPTDKARSNIYSVVATYVGQLATLQAAWSVPGQKRVSIRDFFLQEPGGDAGGRVLILGGNTGYEIAKTYIAAILGVISGLMGDPELQSKDNRTWLFLDEFQELGRIPGLETILAVARGKGIRTVLASQDPGRLETLYGGGIWQSIFANCETKIFAKTGGKAKAEFSALVGDGTFERLSQTFSGGEHGTGSRSWGYTAFNRPIFSPDRFGTDLGLFSAGEKRSIKALVFTGRQKVGLMTWPVVRYRLHDHAHIAADWTAAGYRLFGDRPSPFAATSAGSDAESIGLAVDSTDISA